MDGGGIVELPSWQYFYITRTALYSRKIERPWKEGPILWVVLGPIKHL